MWAGPLRYIGPAGTTSWTIELQIRTGYSHRPTNIAQVKFNVMWLHSALASLALQPSYKFQHPVDTKYFNISNCSFNFKPKDSSK